MNSLYFTCFSYSVPGSVWTSVSKSVLCERLVDDTRNDVDTNFPTDTCLLPSHLSTQTGCPKPQSKRPKWWSIDPEVKEYLFPSQHYRRWRTQRYFGNYVSCLVCHSWVSFYTKPGRANHSKSECGLGKTQTWGSTFHLFSPREDSLNLRVGRGREREVGEGDPTGTPDPSCQIFTE